ncbi:hypothetical protein ACER0C_003218 [Sarotherodon galilaeus]
MAKRKVYGEHREFQARWEAEYMFTEVKGKPVCLLCGESVAVMKEYNLRRHYETSKKHKDKDKNMDTEQRLQKVEELKRGLKSRQALFTKAKSQSEAAVKASFLVAEEVAKSARPFREGEFIKNCMLKVCDAVCPDKQQLFSNVSLSRNTVAERVDQLTTNLKEQLVEKGKDFIAYSPAVDDSTDTTDIAQLSIFIRGVDSSLTETEEFLALRPMHGMTTGQDLYEEVSRCVNEMGLPWEKLDAGRKCHRGVTAYHCIIHQESLCGKALKMEHVMTIITRAVNFIRAKGLNHRQFKAFLGELDTEYGDLPYHTDVRWLSQGKVLQRCFELREEICLFMESKGKDTTELRDETFMCEMAFLCDITSHLNVMNLQLQGRGRVISDMYSTVKAFKTKLSLWETQMQKENLSHFPSCQTMKEKLSTGVFPSARFADKLNILAAKFRCRFADFEAQKNRFELLAHPFGVDVESAPPNLQMELIELQCNDTLREKYERVGAAEFARFIPDTMPQLHIQAAQTLSMFGSTYLCEQLFSLMKLNKTSHRSRLTDKHLDSILRISSAQSLTPNIDELVQKMRHHQVSGSGSDK